MKIAALSLLIGSAAAFAPVQTGRVSTANAAAIDDLKAIAEKSNPVLKVTQCFMLVFITWCAMDDHRLTISKLTL
jgi:hypothetical protein